MCTVSHGLANVVVSYDDGRASLGSDTPFAENEYGESLASSLVALDTPGSLLAIVNDQLYASEDAGCNWRGLGKMHARRLVAGGGGVAYAWGRGTELFAVTTRGVEPLPAAPEAVFGLLAESRARRRLRLFGSSGSVFESRDAGRSWRRVSAAGPRVRAVSADPDDWSHVAAVVDEALSVSHDGGKTWTRSRKCEHVLDVLVAKGGVVWAFSRDRVYRSTDGGDTFVAGAARASSDVEQLVVRAQVDAARVTLISRQRLLRYEAASATWTTLRKVCHPKPTGSMAPLPEAATVAPGTYGALYVAFSSPDQSGEPGVFATSDCPDEPSAAESRTVHERAAGPSLPDTTVPGQEPASVEPSRR